MRITILDLFCCGGGVAKGYYDGFTALGYQVSILGVDIDYQPRYPFPFVQDDALEFFDRHWRDFNFYHGSPPCQQWTTLRAVAGKTYKCYIEETRQRFKATGKPYVIENVPGSPLISPLTLCGLDVGLPLHGHRLFESNVPLESPKLCTRKLTTQNLGRKPIEGRLLARPAGHFSGIDIYRKALEVPWMSQAEIAQTIPPAYTRYIAAQIAKHL